MRPSPACRPPESMGRWTLQSEQFSLLLAGGAMQLQESQVNMGNQTDRFRTDLMTQRSKRRALPIDRMVRPAESGLAENLSSALRAADAEFGQILHEVEEISRSEEHTSELQSRVDLVCRLLLEKKKKI